MLYKKSDLFSFLNSIDKRPKKTLSQNFLIDGNILRKIISSANISPEDIVLEIGPGPGVITEALLANNVQVYAVEKDTNFATELKRLDKNNNLHIFNEDFLKCDLEKILPQNTKIKVIGNLPYHISSPILIKLLSHKKLFSKMTLMFQKEVIQRITASCKTKEYGSLTIFTNYHADIDEVFPVSKNCFYPSPKVDSAVISLSPKASIFKENEEDFFKLTRAVFQKRRKTLYSSIKHLYEPTIIKDLLKSLNLPVMTRGEDLSLEQYIQLFKMLS